MARRPGWRAAQAVDLAAARCIRRRRLELGLTQQRFAELIGVTLQRAHRYEVGTSRISAGRLHSIARALEIEVGHLLADVDPECLGGPGPDEAGQGQRRRLLELVRHAAAIGDPKHRQALCQLARDLAAPGAGAPDDPQVEQPQVSPPG